MHLQNSLLIGFTLLVMVATPFTGCSKSTIEAPPTPGTVAVQNAQEGKTQWIDPNEIQPGPIQRESLTAKQIERIEALQKIFVEIDGQTVAQWTDSFKRDLDPDKELAIWERMAKAYSAYCGDHELSLEARKEVYKVILLRSMASPDDVLDRLELKLISKQEAEDVMAGY